MGEGSEGPDGRTRRCSCLPPAGGPRDAVDSVETAETRVGWTRQGGQEADDRTAPTSPGREESERQNLQRVDVPGNIPGLYCASAVQRMEFAVGRAEVKEGASRKRDRGDEKKKTNADVSRQVDCVIRARLSSAPTKKSRLSLLRLKDGIRARSRSPQRHGTWRVGRRCYRVHRWGSSAVFLCNCLDIVATPSCGG